MTTPEWDLQRGFSDWGMNCQHRITEGDQVVALIPSVTPYALNAPAKQKAYAKKQWENAKLVQVAPTLKEIAEEFLDKMMRFGDWDDGCFYYNKVSASELQGLIEKAVRIMDYLIQ
jgi:hypothetical protein